MYLSKRNTKTFRSSLFDLHLLSFQAWVSHGFRFNHKPKYTTLVHLPQPCLEERRQDHTTTPRSTCLIKSLPFLRRQERKEHAMLVENREQRLVNIPTGIYLLQRCGVRNKHALTHPFRRRQLGRPGRNGEVESVLDHQIRDSQPRRARWRVE